MPTPEIVIVAETWFPTVGGLEKALHRTASELRRSGISVTVLTADDGRYRGDFGYEVELYPSENILEPATAFIARCRPRISIFSRLFKGKESVQAALVQSRCRSSYNVLRVPSIWYPEYVELGLRAEIARAFSAFVSLNQVTFDQLQGVFPDHSHVLAWNVPTLPRAVTSRPDTPRPPVCFSGVEGSQRRRTWRA